MSTFEKKVTLKSADGNLFEVDEAVAMEFITVKSFLEEETSISNIVIPLNNVNAKELILVINFCQKEVEFRDKLDSEPEKKKEFVEDFLKNMSSEEMLEVLAACNYLNVKYLLDLLTEDIAKRIANKSVSYVRRLFGIQNDFTPEEEAERRAEYEWAHEGVDADE